MKNWNPAIWRYFIFRGTLSRVYLPILVVFMLHQGLSLEQIALVTVIGQIAGLIFEIPSGATADTLGHKRTLVIAMLGEAMSALLFIGGTLPWFIAGTLGYALFASLQSGTSEALFFEYLQSIGRKNDHLALLGQGKSLAWILNMLAVFLGGATYGLHQALPFIGCAIVFTAGAIAIAGFPAANSPTSVEKREGFIELLHHFPRGMRVILSHPYVFWLVAVNALLIGAISGSNDFQQIIFTNLGASALFIGGVYAAKRALSVLLSGYAYRLKRTSPFILMVVFMLFTGFYMIITPYISSIVVYGGVVLLSIIVLALLDVLFNDWLNQAIPSLSRATTLSIANFAESVVAIIAASMFGWLQFAPQHTFRTLGVAVVVITVIPLIRLAQTEKSVPITA